MARGGEWRKEFPAEVANGQIVCVCACQIY